MMTNSRAGGRACVVGCVSRGAHREKAHVAINVKVVIFRNFFARRYRNMRGAQFFYLSLFFIFFFFLTKCEAAGKKCKAGRLADYIPGETL